MARNNNANGKKPSKKKNNKNLGKIVRNSEIARENYVFHN